MEIAVWIVSGLVAAMYLLAGIPKLKEFKLPPSPKAGGPELGVGQARVIGVIEILGAIGVILPELLNVATILTPIAATGLVIVQIGAITFHSRRGEKWPVNAVLLVLAAFVAVARFAGV